MMDIKTYPQSEDQRHFWGRLLLLLFMSLFLFQILIFLKHFFFNGNMHFWKKNNFFFKKTSIFRYNCRNSFVKQPNQTYLYCFCFKILSLFLFQKNLKKEKKNIKEPFLSFFFFQLLSTIEVLLSSCWFDLSATNQMVTIFQYTGFEVISVHFGALHDI